MASRFCGVLFGLVLMLAGVHARAQGCSQCRDTVSQTNPAQQQSYREAIGIMLAGALGVVSAGVFVMRRFGR